MQAAAKESLADQPDVAELAQLVQCKDGPCALSYQDTRGQFLTFYPWLQIGVQMVAKQLKKEGIDVNTAALPSTSAIAPHLLPTTSAAVKNCGWF